MAQHLVGDWDTVEEVHMLMHKGLMVAAVSGIFMLAVPECWGQAYYTVNGVPVTPDVAAAMAAGGIAPGHYWLDQNGYWGVVGSQRPLGNLYEGSYLTQQGGGEQGSNGWSYYNSTTGTSVGGDSNGCYYTEGWSNC